MRLGRPLLRFPGALQSLSRGMFGMFDSTGLASEVRLDTQRGDAPCRFCTFRCYISKASAWLGDFVPGREVYSNPFGKLLVVPQSLAWSNECMLTTVHPRTA